MCFVTCPSHVMVPKAGLEPARSRLRGILSPLRLPFRHFGSFWRHHPDSDWGIKVLQTSALPLGYGAITLYNMLRTRSACIFCLIDHLLGDGYLGAGDGVPVCTGTCAALRYGPAAGQMLRIYCYAIRIPTGECFGAGDGVPDSRGPTRCSGAAPAGLNCHRSCCFAVESLISHSLERETGFGPATFALARQRSTTEPLPRECSITISNYDGFCNSFF